VTPEEFEVKAAETENHAHIGFLVAVSNFQRAMGAAEALRGLAAEERARLAKVKAAAEKAKPEPPKTEG